MDSWLGLLEQGHLLDADLGLQQAQLCFLWSHMMVVDEVKDFARHESLSFVDFLEALARVAELKSLPSFSDLEDAGYGDPYCTCRITWTVLFVNSCKLRARWQTALVCSSLVMCPAAVTDLPDPVVCTTITSSLAVK